MLLSQLFLPILKETPREAEIISHRLMLRSGMISQSSSGIYNWLPLGLKILNNISTIVREELDKAGCNEILMPILQPGNLWQESDRYDSYGKEMLRVTDRHENQMLFGPTNEEIVTDIFRKFITSYKSLPQNLYQIQWKFRDEIRPRFGVMRGREFLMKDAYSFDIDAESALKSYKTYYETYLKIFNKLGVTAIPVRADNGAIGGDLSHEFHILAETGESQVFCDEILFNKVASQNYSYDELKDYYAAADEMHDATKSSNIKLLEKRGIEVGHIFNFATKYSDKMNAVVTNKEGKPVNVNMGSYGIGISRLVAAIIESSHDDKGIIWPESIAPFDIIILNLKNNDEETSKKSLEIYHKLQKTGHKILLDDSKNSPGNKFATADLIGIPKQIIIGPKNLKDGKIEIKNRKTGEANLVDADSY